MLLLSLLFIIVVYSLPSLSKLSHSFYTTMILSSLILSFALALNAIELQAIGEGLGVLSASLNATPITLVFSAFILFVASILLLSFPKLNNTNLSVQYNISESIISKSNDYSLIVLFSTLGSVLLLSANNFIIFYLALELQSFGVYLLSSLNKESEASTAAGLKYFLLGCLASCLVLLGSVLVYSYTGLISFDDLYSLYSVTYEDNNMMKINIALTLIILGLLFKIAAAPLHFWSIDVYQDTPTIVTMWLTIMPKIAIILLLLELFNGFGIKGLFMSMSIKTLLIISSALSLIVGSLMGLAQTKIKRLLAYSTISHIGFILLVLAINTEESTSALLFYLIQYSLTNAVIFLVLLYISYINFNKKELNFNTTEGIDLIYNIELKSLIFKNNWLALALVIALFSMAGIPPLTGFFAKQAVLLSAAQMNYYLMAILAIVVSVISATYYLKLIVLMYTEDKTNDNMNNNNNDNTRTSIYIPSGIHSYLISTITIVLISFVFNPMLLLNATQLMSLSIY